MALLGSETQPRVHPHRLDARRLRFQWPRWLTIPLLLFAIVTGFYWKLVFTYQFDWMWSPDMADQVLPWWQEAARQLHQGHLPLWDTHNWMGQPLLGQAQPGVAYPLNWLLWLTPREHGVLPMWEVNWYYVVMHYMAALFCYWLCRDLGRSRAASLIGGLAFSLVGYIGWTDWPQMVNGAVWAPLVFLFLLRAVRGVRPWASAALSGACIGMAWLSGHHQVPIFLTLAAAGAWLYYVLKDGRPNWRMAWMAVVAMIFAPVVGALQILPAQEYGRLAYRWAGGREPFGWQDVIPYYIHTKHAMHPMYIFGIVIPGYGEHTGVFLGVAVVTLTLLAIAVWWREHLVKFFVAIALGALVYSFGANSVFNGFIYAVLPFVEKARVPAMAKLLFDVAFCVLAAFGVDALAAYKESGADWIRRINLAVAAFALILGITVLAVLIANKFWWDWDDRVAMTVLFSILLAALLYAWRTSNLTRGQAITLLTLLLLFEAGQHASFMLADRNDSERRSFLDKAWGNSDIAEFLEKQPRPFRVVTKTEEIERNWGDFYNVDFPTAQAGVTVNTYHLPTHLASAQKLVGVKFTLARTKTDPAQSEVFRGASGIAVFENAGAFNPAWAVHEIVPVKDVDEARAFIEYRGEELREKALSMEQPLPTVPPCAAAKDLVFVTKYEPSDVTISADLSCAGMVVLSDTYYPGWYAAVDGRPTAIHEVDIAFRGVEVPKGAHVIRFRYRPRSVYWGAALTFTGLLGAVLLTWQSGKKRRSAHAHH